MVRRNNHRLNGAGWGSANKVRLPRSLAAFRTAGGRAAAIGSTRRGASASATSQRRRPASLCDTVFACPLDELQLSALLLRHPVAEQADRADVGIGPQLAAVAGLLQQRADALRVHQAQAVARTGRGRIAGPDEERGGGEARPDRTPEVEQPQAIVTELVNAAVAAAMAEVDALLVEIAAARPAGYVAEKGVC